MTSKTQNRNDLETTPPLPATLNEITLTENARQVLIKRYVRRGEERQPAETVEEMFWRVAYHIARVEEQCGCDSSAHGARNFTSCSAPKRFFPNSPTFTGAGTPLGQLAACFVLPITDDMGRKSTGIFQTLRDAALIQQTGGGNGFSFSRLRPKGTLVKTSAGQATGPVGFLRVYDHAFGEVAQGGTRRGANMAVLRVDHPDVEEFITCKTNENPSPTSISPSASPMPSCTPWKTTASGTCASRMCTTRATAISTARFEQAEAAGIPLRVYKTVRARDLFEKIVQQAHHNGEPGRALPGCRQPLQPRPAPLSAGSHQSLRRAVAGTLRELLPGFDQSGPAPRPRPHGGLGRSCAEYRALHPLPG